MLARPGRRPGRPGRHLPAAAARDRRRRAGARPARGDLHADLLGLRARPPWPAACADCGARLLITADGFRRRGAVVPLKQIADEAVAPAPSVERVLVVRRLGRARRSPCPWTAGRDLWWDEAHGRPGGRARWRDAPETDPETPYMIIYTSGTTGRPKGAVHVHGGFPIKGAQDLAHCFDLRARRHALLVHRPGLDDGSVGDLAARCCSARRWSSTRARPTTRRPTASGRIVERHRVTHLGLSPTVIRALMAHGTDPVRAHDLRVAARPRLDRRALEPRALVVVLPRGRRRPLPDHQLQRRHRGERRHRVRQPDHAHQAGVVRRPAAWACAADVVDADGAARARARSASWSSASRCRA